MNSPSSPSCSLILASTRMKKQGGVSSLLCKMQNCTQDRRVGRGREAIIKGKEFRDFVNVISSAQRKRKSRRFYFRILFKCAKLALRNDYFIYAEISRLFPFHIQIFICFSNFCQHICKWQFFETEKMLIVESWNKNTFRIIRKCVLERWNLIVYGNWAVNTEEENDDTN